MREYGNVGDYFLLELPDFSVMDRANVVGKYEPIAKPRGVIGFKRAKPGHWK